MEHKEYLPDVYRGGPWSKLELEAGKNDQCEKSIGNWFGLLEGIRIDGGDIKQFITAIH